MDNLKVAGRTWFDRNRWQLSRVIFTACFAFLDPLLGGASFAIEGREVR
jgi:hypothetical protein